MLTIKDLKKYYDLPSLSERGVLREYLQYKILNSIFKSPIKNKIVFLGGTAIRIVHGSNRFSEDLDFDNFNLSYDEFFSASKIIKRQLELEGFIVEIRNVEKGAYHCYIKFPELLYENGLSPLKDEKILIQIDTVAQGFEYEPDRYILNKFNVTGAIQTTPVDILLAQKFYTVFNRKRIKGRDFFDIVYLMGLTTANYEYLSLKIQIDNPKDLKDYILEKCKYLDFKKISNDVSPFLINQEEVNKVLLFSDIIKQSNL